MPLLGLACVSCPELPQRAIDRLFYKSFIDVLPHFFTEVFILIFPCISLVLNNTFLINQKAAQMNYTKMKGAFLATFLLKVLAGNAQVTDTLAKNRNPRLSYERYMQERATNLTFGWVLVGTGVGLASTWFLVNSANGWNGSTKVEGMFEAGIATAVLSTPFFIMAGANKRNARLALKGERLTSAVMFHRTTYPALSFSINL
jgi:hypothetical protein